MRQPTVISVADAVLTHPDPAVSGTAQAKDRAILETNGVLVGIWEVTAGEFEDEMEGDEMFVVSSGRATIVPADGSAPFDIAAGDVCTFPAGYRSRWIVHEALRKAYHYTDPS